MVISVVAVADVTTVKTNGNRKIIRLVHEDSIKTFVLQSAVVQNNISHQFISVMALTWNDLELLINAHYMILNI